MDSLGGILIKGLLGNPILAKFKMFFDLTIEDVTPTPTPSGTPTPTPTSSYEPPDPSATPGLTLTPTPTPGVSATLPTPTPYVEPTPTVIQVNWGHGGGSGGGGLVLGKEEKRTVKITIRYKTREWVSIHTVTDKILRVTINTITFLNKVKKKMYDISLKITKKEPTTVKVKLHDD